MRELREFRALHAEYQASQVALAGVCIDPPALNGEWEKRLALPFPLLSDTKREAGRAFGVLRRIGIAGWSVEFLKRTTFLAGRDGIVGGVWGRVKVRGHAAEVLNAARALDRS